MHNLYSEWNKEEGDQGQGACGVSMLLACRGGVATGVGDDGQPTAGLEITLSMPWDRSVSGHAVNRHGSFPPVLNLTRPRFYIL